MFSLSAHGLDTAASSLTLSQTFLQYSLFVGMLALGAGAVFFLLSKDKVRSDYQGTVTTSALICGVAAAAYYYLLSDYNPALPFPQMVRYADWTVTTPLLLLKYPEMLRLRGFAFGWKLVLADLFMIVTGFIGEQYGHTIGGQWVASGPGAVGTHYVWGTVSTLGYAVIVALLITEGAKLARTQPQPIQHGIRAMNLYLLTLWGVYPIAYIAEGVSASNPGLNLDWFNMASSVADVINKVGFGLTAYFAVRALSGDDQNSSERLSEAEGV